MPTTSGGGTNDYYNPMYISDDAFGGYARLPDDDRVKVTTYAGLDQDGRPLVGGNGVQAVSTGEYSANKRNNRMKPSPAGRLCLWTPSDDELNADLLGDFGEYFSHLRLKCGEGASGTLVWTPDQVGAS